MNTKENMDKWVEYINNLNVEVLMVDYIKTIDLSNVNRDLAQWREFHTHLLSETHAIQYRGVAYHFHSRGKHAVGSRNDSILLTLIDWEKIDEFSRMINL